MRVNTTSLLAGFGVAFFLLFIFLAISVLIFRCELPLGNILDVLQC
jgi:hypothetical protein